MGKQRRIFSRQKRRAGVLPQLLFILLILFILILAFKINTQAACLDDAGYTALSTVPGSNIPTGSTIMVSQIEAPDGNNAYMPNNTLAEFSGKTIVNKTGISEGVSSHATSVGYNFYGKTLSMAGCTSDILRRLDYVVETDEFIQVTAVNNGSTQQPLPTSLTIDLPSRIKLRTD